MIPFSPVEFLITVIVFVIGVGLGNHHRAAHQPKRNEVKS